MKDLTKNSRLKLVYHKYSGVGKNLLFIKNCYLIHEKRSEIWATTPQKADIIKGYSGVVNIYIIINYIITLYIY